MALIIPEIFADVLNEKLDTSLRIGKNVAFDATSNVNDIINYGGTIRFPRLSRVVVADEVARGGSITPATIDMTDVTATVKQVGASVRVLDQDVAQIKGNLVDQLAIQLSEDMSKKLDADLVAEMDASAALKVPTAAADAITADELFDAISLFGDSMDTASFAALIVSPRLYKSFLTMDEFVAVGNTFNAAGNGLVEDGVIGFFAGVKVVVCSNGTYDADKSEVKSYLVKNGVLSYIRQKDILVEEERESKDLATDLVVSSLYAVKLLDASGVVVLRKTIV